MTVASPQVAVVCAWYNRAEYIRDTVDSLLYQNFQSFEIVIVNDGSSDPQVKEILDSYDDPRLIIIHQGNKGFVESIRTAIDASGAPYIAIQGAGDVSYPDRLRKQWEILSNRCDIVAVACEVRQVIFGGNNHGRIEGRAVSKRKIKNSDILAKTPVTHGEVMFKRELYSYVGGYRSFFKYAQDRDLWLRMTEHGDFYIVNEVLYERRRFVEDGVSTSVEKKILQKRLSVFATQCAEDRKKYGLDLLDEYGAQAGLFFMPSSATAAVLARSSVKYLLVDDLQSARIVCLLSLREKITVTGLLCFLLVAASRLSLIRNSIGKVLDRIGIVAKDKAPTKPFCG